MKYLLVYFSMLAVITVQAQQAPPPAASISEVVAGTVRNKYVSPYALAQAGGPQPLSAGQATNLVNAVTNGDTRNLTLNGNVTFAGAIYGSGQNLTNTATTLGANLLGSNGTTGAWMLVMDGSGKLGTNGIPSGGGGGSGNVASNSVVTFSLINTTNASSTNSFAGTIQAGQIVATNLFALGSSTNGYFALYTNSSVIYAVWYQTNFPAGGGGGGSSFPLSANVSAGGFAIGNIGALVINGGTGITITNGGINWNGIAGVSGGDLLYVDGSRTLTWSPGANTDGSHAGFYLSCYPYARIRGAYSGSGGSGSAGAVELDTDINGGWESTGKMGAQAGFQFGNTNGVTGTIAIQTNASGPHGINLLFSGGILTSNTTY
jgi:hypothetical protein